MRSTGFIPTTTPGNRLIACVLLPTADLERTLSIAEALSRFTPSLALRGSDKDSEHALFLDLTRSLSLFKPEWLPLKIQAVLLRFAPHAFHFAFGADPGSALALAQLAQAQKTLFFSGKTDALAQLPLSALEHYLFPFLPDSERDPDEKRTLKNFIEVLQRLGVQSLGELTQIPLSSFASRFKKSAHHWVHRVFYALQNQPNALFEEPWPALRFPEKIEERFAIACEDPSTLSACSGLDTLLFCLKTLSDRVFARLRGRSLRLAGLEIQVDLENHKSITLSISLPVPQSSASGLLSILRDRIQFEFGESQKARIDSPITTLFLRATETAPSAFSQKHFFSEEERLSEAWESFLGRVLPKLGKDRVFLTHPTERHLPEASWRKITQELLFQELTRKNPIEKREESRFPDRPTLLLKEPVPVSLREDVLSCSTLERHWQILSTSFAERLSGDWWEEARGFAREYYQIQAREVSRAFSSESATEPVKLWVFFTPQNQAFLHGYFD